MVKVTGRARDRAHLRGHLDDIARNGQLDLEVADGAIVAGRLEVADLAAAWATEALADSRRRVNALMSLLACNSATDVWAPGNLPP